jgi:hypothetical protein
VSYCDQTRRYTPGRTQITAKRLNELGSRFTRTERDARTVDLTQKHPIVVKGAVRMRLKSVDYDYIVCRTLDDADNEGSEDIKVAKPHELQKTPWHTKHIVTNTYNVTGVQAVTVTPDTGTPENWVVIPTYQVAVTNYDGAVIYAVQPDGGTGVTVSGEKLTWQDINVAGRAWAKS